jgi:glycosyltransferase involved in cell wall biosynthesis
VLKLYHDPSLREELGRNGRRYAEEHLSLEACGGRYEELLQRIAEEGKGSAIFRIDNRT